MHDLSLAAPNTQKGYFDGSNQVHLIISCPTCGYEQEVILELVNLDNPLHKFVKMLTETTDVDEYKFIGYNVCGNCKKKMAASFIVTSHDSKYGGVI